MQTHRSPATLAAFGLIACAAHASVADERSLLTGHVASQGLPPSRGATLARAPFSADGRFVAFVARPAGNLLRCCQQVHVLDRLTGALTLESRSEAGDPAEGDSLTPSLSDDAGRIAFETAALTLVGERPSVARVVLRDRRTGSLRTPRGYGGRDPDGTCTEPMLSGDGRVVAFTSTARNLVDGPDANGEHADVYVWIPERDTVSRISVDESGTQSGIGASHSPTVSRDGTVVAFTSSARLTLDDSNKCPGCLPA